MPKQAVDSSSAKDRMAQFAVAQFLLFDAAVESLSVLGERLASRRKAEQDELVEPFRARYRLMRRVLREK
jgi:hypothetical protein